MKIGGVKTKIQTCKPRENEISKLYTEEVWKTFKEIIVKMTEKNMWCSDTE